MPFSTKGLHPRVPVLAAFAALCDDDDDDDDDDDEDGRRLRAHKSSPFSVGFG